MNQENKFHLLWDKLDELTGKEVTERKNKASSSGPANSHDEPQPLCALPGVDPPRRRRKSSQQVSNWYVVLFVTL